MKIGKDETKIIGHWLFDGSKMTADVNCARIDSLLNDYLTLISVDKSGWLKLYQDPNDKRYWQFDFENGETQGGGPPSLTLLSELQAKDKFNF